MYEYLKSLDKDSIEFVHEAANAQFELDKLAIENEYEMAIRLIDLSNKAVTESEDEAAVDEVPKSKRVKFAEKIGSMQKALTSSIGKTLDSVGKKVAGDDGADIKDYLDAKIGEIRLEQDIKRIQEDVIKAAREGDQLVQAISKGLNIDDEKVDNFIQKTKEVVENNTEAVITASAAATVYAAQVTIYDMNKKKLGEDGIYQQCKTMEGQSKVNKIKNAMANMFQKEDRIFSIFMTKFGKLANK